MFIKKKSGRDVLIRGDAGILEVVSRLSASSPSSSFPRFCVSLFFYNKHTYQMRGEGNKGKPFSHLPWRDQMQKNDRGVTESTELLWSYRDDLQFKVDSWSADHTDRAEGVVVLVLRVIRCRGKLQRFAFLGVVLY